MISQIAFLNSKAELYADDTQVYSASHDVSELEIKLNEDLKEINVWLCANPIRKCSIGFYRIFCWKSIYNRIFCWICFPTEYSCLL